MTLGFRKVWKPITHVRQSECSAFYCLAQFLFEIIFSHWFAQCNFSLISQMTFCGIRRHYPPSCLLYYTQTHVGRVLYFAFVLRWNGKIHRDISPLFFKCVKRPKFVLDFRLQSRLTLSHLETEQDICIQLAAWQQLTENNASQKECNCPYTKWYAPAAKKWAKWTPYWFHIVFR